MIFADKLIRLRKRNGWSQEELAEKMSVSRQSVSKWESVQAVPDLEKMVRLSRLFGVSTDYLLKDEVEEEENVEVQEEVPSLRQVTMEEASDFLAVKERAAFWIAMGVVLCILSPIPLLLLAAASELTPPPVSEPMAAGIGMVALLGFVTVAVAIFLWCHGKVAKFQYLNGPIETQYGVREMAKERQTCAQGPHIIRRIAGVCLCILALVPLFVGMMIAPENVFFMVAALCFTFLIVGVGVFILVRSELLWAAFHQILEEGEYTREKKEWLRKEGEYMQGEKENPLPRIYWSLTLALYLGYSFVTFNWGYSWIIWPVAAVLYPAVTGIASAWRKK